MAMLEDRRKEVRMVKSSQHSPWKPTSPVTPPTHQPTNLPTYQPIQTEGLIRFFKTKVEAEDRVAADLYRCSRSPIASESGVADKSRQV